MPMTFVSREPCRFPPPSVHPMGLFLCMNIERLAGNHTHITAGKEHLLLVCRYFTTRLRGIGLATWLKQQEVGVLTPSGKKEETCLTILSNPSLTVSEDLKASPAVPIGLTDPELHLSLSLFPGISEQEDP